MFGILVGEVGIDRKEFLYELRCWEIKMLMRGYYRRQRSGWEQARLVAYNAAFAFGSKSTPPTMTEWLKFPWEREPASVVTNEEYERLQRLMREENARLEAERKKKGTE